MKKLLNYLGINSKRNLFKFDKFYFYFSNGQQIFINDLNRRSNDISSVKNRPIAVFHYDPNKSIFFLTNP